MSKTTMYLLILLSISLQQSYSQSINVMTYNIKYDNKSDTINNWNDRKETMVELIKYYEPSFLGIQEGLDNQVSFLNNSLATYNYVGVGRDDGVKKGEYSAIFYKTALFKVLKSKTIWLSKTPDEVSVGWDASMERICTYALFQHKETKKKYWVFNTHFDHIGVLARKNSAKLIIKTIKEVNSQNLPVVLMGDLNLTPSQDAITTINNSLQDSYTASQKPPYGPKGTFNGFTNKIMKNRIDYIFVQGFTVKSVLQIDDKMNNNKHISDHIPVLATLTSK